MPIRVACGCGQQFDAPDALAGTFVPCPVCQNGIAIPMLSGTPAHTPPSPGVIPGVAPGGPAVPNAMSVDQGTSIPTCLIACGCGAQYSATIDMAGMQMQCATCGQLLFVPSLPTNYYPGHNPQGYWGVPGSSPTDPLGIGDHSPYTEEGGKTLSAAQGPTGGSTRRPHASFAPNPNVGNSWSLTGAQMALGDARREVENNRSYQRAERSRNRFFGGIAAFTGILFIVLGVAFSPCLIVFGVSALASAIAYSSYARDD